MFTLNLQWGYFVQLKLKNVIICALQTLEELRKVAAMTIGGNRVWIGGYRESGGSSPWTGAWKWTDGTHFKSYKNLSYNGESPSGFYDGKEELNIEIIPAHGGFINDRNGEAKLSFVCKSR